MLICSFPISTSNYETTLQWHSCTASHCRNMRRFFTFGRIENQQTTPEKNGLKEFAFVVQSFSVWKCTPSRFTMAKHGFSAMFRYSLSSKLISSVDEYKLQNYFETNLPLCTRSVMQTTNHEQWQCTKLYMACVDVCAHEKREKHMQISRPPEKQRRLLCVQSEQKKNTIQM